MPPHHIYFGALSLFLNQLSCLLFETQSQNTLGPDAECILMDLNFIELYKEESTREFQQSGFVEIQINYIGRRNSHAGTLRPGRHDAPHV